ncbi:MAG: bifunctional UDP-N-acetylglucosamine diphosphorylase/glucosamine-1-phosphate N-acetyltransferase GlmU [Gammaproteobacteria bacterium]|nr:MAG: bifunctional UDP-N-acetylglucosamine diphosphorylase/glucosamine-1-phosphate N-acetyltransferase GlmU [Gammaproteobacteria bacterium]
MGRQDLELSIIILAAGRGTRMRSRLPKVLQPLAGQPLLQHVVSCAKALHANDICVVHGYGGERVREAFAGQGLRWALQREQLGTGHAVRQGMPGTPLENRVLVLSGDVPLLRPATLTRLVAACDDEDVAILTVDADDPHGYGRILRRDGSVIGNVEEKDASGEQKKIREINTGVSCYPAGGLQGWLAKLDNDNSQGEYYLTDVLGMAVADGITVHGVKAECQEEVMGINDKKQLAEAERALQRRRVEELMAAGVGFADPARVDIRGRLVCGQDVFIDINAVFEGDVTLGDNVRVESNNLIRDSRIDAGTVVHPNCHIEGATTGDDCEIGPYSRLRPGAALGCRVKVGNFVEIKKSTVADGSKINHLSYIGDTRVGKGVNVGAGTITCNYDGANKYQTIIGDHAFIGSGVELVAPVEIGAGATIGAGSTISRAAPADKLTLERSKQRTITNWEKPRKQKRSEKS